LLDENMADEGTFLTSLKGKKITKMHVTVNDEQKALVLFGPPKEKKKNYMVRNLSTTTINDRDMKNFKKPPIYLPELRDRKDIWMGKSSGALIAQKKLGSKSKFDPIANLRANKKWFLVPDRNVLLWLNDKDLNDELKNMNKNHFSRPDPKPKIPGSLAEEKWNKFKAKNKVKMGEAITNLKSIQNTNYQSKSKNAPGVWYSQKEHTNRVILFWSNIIFTVILGDE
jgi:hypothetical protein